MAIERITPDNPAEWRGLGLQHLQRYDLASRFAQDKAVLDLACGNGYGSYTLMNLGAQSVTGFDLDPSAIEYAKSHYSKPNLTFRREDCFSVKPAGSGYDVIVSFETIEHLQHPDKFIKKLRDLISARGRLVISAPNTLCYKRAPVPVANPYHFSEPTYAEFREWVETEFVIDQEWEQSPVTLGYSRQSALVEKSGFIRWLLLMECSLKRLLRRPSLDSMLNYVDSQALHSGIFTQIFPLLPERRNLADVFIFVCHPRR